MFAQRKNTVLTRLRLKWKDNIEMDLQEIRWEMVDRNYLVQIRENLMVLMNAVMNCMVVVNTQGISLLATHRYVSQAWSFEFDNTNSLCNDSLWAGRSGYRFWWERYFPHPSGPTLWSTQPPIRWVPGLSLE
jgi:hypothetical protein